MSMNFKMQTKEKKLLLLFLLHLKCHTFLLVIHNFYVDFELCINQMYGVLRERETAIVFESRDVFTRWRTGLE